MKIIRHLVGVAAAGVFFGAGSLGAQSTLFKGTTSGCFVSSAFDFPDCPNTAGLGLDQSLGFAGGSFDQTTAFDASTGLWSASIGDANHLSSNFGWFNLFPVASDYSDNLFKLAITFADPTNVSPGAVFSAVLYGNVDRRGDGGVYIDFGTPQTYSFNGPTYSGTFTLALDDVMLSPTWSDPSAITGTVTTNITGGGVTATPEPGTTALMATGLIGLIPVVRRRNKKAQSV